MKNGGPVKDHRPIRRNQYALIVPECHDRQVADDLKSAGFCQDIEEMQSRSASVHFRPGKPHDRLIVVAGIQQTALHIEILTPAWIEPVGSIDFQHQILIDRILDTGIPDMSREIEGVTSGEHFPVEQQVHCD